jgi:hypothetical protein
MALGLYHQPLKSIQVHQDWLDGFCKKVSKMYKFVIRSSFKVFGQTGIVSVDPKNVCRIVSVDPLMSI